MGMSYSIGTFNSGNLWNHVTMKKILIALGAVTLLGIAGCSGTDQGAMPIDSMGSNNMVAEAMPSDMATDSSRGQVTEQVIRTGSISLISNNAIKITDQVIALVNQFDGSVSQEDTRIIEEREYANLVVQVPDSELESFINQVTDLAPSTAVSISELNVTLTITDLDARIASLDATIAKLSDLQQQATSVADLVAVEAELATRTAERDSLVAQREVLQNQVAKSTVYIDISPDLDRSTNSPDFIGGIESGWQALINLGAGAITLLGFLIPIALMIAVVTFVLIAISRAMKWARQRN
jgi:hypothetical protein